MISDFHAPSTRRFLFVNATKSRLASAALIASLLVVATVQAQTPGPSPAATAESSPAAVVAATAKADMIGVIKAAGNFKTFLKAVEAADLVSTLQKPGPLTVFAPTDTAFSKLPAGTLDELLKPENKAKLVKLLSYHIATGKYPATALAKADEVKTLEGTEIDVEATPDGKTIEVDDAKILGSDIDASNGVLHAIDSVLQP